MIPGRTSVLNGISVPSVLLDDNRKRALSCMDGSEHMMIKTTLQEIRRRLIILVLIVRISPVQLTVVQTRLTFYKFFYLYQFWTPYPGSEALFFILPALWGTADAVWQTQLNGGLVKYYPQCASVIPVPN